MQTEKEIWHRFEDRRVSVSDPWTGEACETRTVVEHIKLYVVKHTPKGVWVAPHVAVTRRFVLLKARKRYAYPTVEEALESFIARKKMQIRIYLGRAERAELAIKLARVAAKEIEHELRLL